MKTVQIPIRGAVECGKPIPTDWNKWIGDAVREVSSIRNKIPFAKYDSYPVCGESLKAIGIYDGDFLVCRETQHQTAKPRSLPRLMNLALSRFTIRTVGASGGVLTTYDCLLLSFALNATTNKPLDTFLVGVILYLPQRTAILWIANSRFRKWQNILG